MDYVLSVVPPGNDRVVEEGEELQLGAAHQRLQVSQLLQGVVGQDQRAQVWQTQLEALADPDDPVVVQHEILHAVHIGKTVQLPDLVVAEVDGVVLVQRRAQVLNHWDLVSPDTRNRFDTDK